MTERQGPWMIFEIPNDTALLAAFGKVTLHHSHLDYVLRMTVKTLSGLTIEEALDATAFNGSATLHKTIRVLARRRLGEGDVLLKLQALLQHAQRLTEKRNDFVHSIWARELDGEHMMRSTDHRWRALPTVNELDQLAQQIETLRDEINDARLRGFLLEALEAKG